MIKKDTIDFGAFSDTPFLAVQAALEFDNWNLGKKKKFGHANQLILILDKIAKSNKFHIEFGYQMVPFLSQLYEDRINKETMLIELQSFVKDSIQDLKSGMEEEKTKIEKARDYCLRFCNILKAHLDTRTKLYCI